MLKVGHPLFLDLQEVKNAIAIKAIQAIAIFFFIRRLINPSLFLNDLGASYVAK
jgi:hypothetical protein